MAGYAILFKLHYYLSILYAVLQISS